jgi:F-type H+-transporting ATPase subunit epsilon
MPHAKFRVEVLSPDGLVFDDEVEMVSTRTTTGVIGVLARHAPLLGALEPSELRLYRSDDDIVRYAASEGYIQVADNRAMLLVGEVQEPDRLDVGRLRELLSQAEDEIASSEEDSERRRQALREKRRWQAFLRVAEDR